MYCIYDYVCNPNEEHAVIIVYFQRTKPPKSHTLVLIFYCFFLKSIFERSHTLCTKKLRIMDNCVQKHNIKVHLKILTYILVDDSVISKTSLQNEVVNVRGERINRNTTTQKYANEREYSLTKVCKFVPGKVKSHLQLCRRGEMRLKISCREQDDMLLCIQEQTSGI